MLEGFSPNDGFRLNSLKLVNDRIVSATKTQIDFFVDPLGEKVKKDETQKSNEEEADREERDEKTEGEAHFMLWINYIPTVENLLIFRVLFSLWDSLINGRE